MKCLVTGSEGFVGRHFVRRLRSEGHKVFRCDIIDPDGAKDCRDIFRTNSYSNMDLIIHCAATIPPIDKRFANDLIVAQDFSLDAEMFQWASRVLPGRVVYFSSAAAYPAHLQQKPYLMTEDDIDLHAIGSPEETYGLTKLVGEVQAMELRRQGVEVMVLRPFTGYGTDQALSYPFPAMIERAVEKIDPFVVWGTGEQVRDFIHIDDIVGAVMTMLHKGLVGPVNLASGHPVTMLELARQICAEAEYEPEIRTLPDKPVGAPYRCGDATLLKTFYHRQVSLTEGIQMALAGV